jgi:hypothetical protein
VPTTQFGTHALFHSYQSERSGDRVAVDLWFEVLATLLPPHNVFVHAIDSSGATVAQCDRPPQSATDGPAPTGSWVPGESIHAECDLTIPPDTGPITLQVGLYEPESGVRLPVSVEGETIGDSVTVPVAGE